MNSLFITLLISITCFIVFLYFQIKYFALTKKARSKFESFFEKASDYVVVECCENSDKYPQLDLVGGNESDLNKLLGEINHYLYKTKGTSDYEFIRNKVERKLNMLYDQSMSHIAFPTYIGLMGTFMGVFIGILFFLLSFKNGNITDESIYNLLIGVLVSMSTSLVGLFLTTKNNHKAVRVRKKIEDEKNSFFDFIQTDVTKTANASLVTAIGRLHETVDKFEPAFTHVIDGFKDAFAECTSAFGEDFKEKVSAVTDAVAIMGDNMDKINENISQQKELLKTINSRDFVRGLENYVQAANHFVGITQSLNKFEEARRMMLAAAQEAIELQNQYSDSLRIPREIAIRVNQILDRIKDFENSVNEAGRALTQRDILGNDIVNKLKEQIDGIAKKNRVADRFVELADEELERLYATQVAVINGLNIKYREAIEEHLESFEKMLINQTEELSSRHDLFMETLEERFSVESVREEFTNLRKLVDIEKRLEQIMESSVKPANIHTEISELVKEIHSFNATLKDGAKSVQDEVKAFKNEVKPDIAAINKNTRDSKGGITIFGGK